MPEAGITKKALAQALKDLMSEKAFSKISVSDICALCDMNRKSFYYHFKDKYNLVNWIFFNDFIGAVAVKEYTDNWEFIEDMCNYFYQNRKFYKNALQVSGQNSFREYFREMLQPITKQYLSEIFENSDNADFYAVFFTDALLVSIIRWLSTSPCLPSEEFTALMKKAVQGVAKKIVGKLNEDEKKPVIDYK